MSKGSSLCEMSPVGCPSCQKLFRFVCSQGEPLAWLWQVVLMHEHLMVK